MRRGEPRRRRVPDRESRARLRDDLLVQRGVFRCDTSRTKLTLDRMPRAGVRPPFLQEELDDRARERQWLLLGDDGDIPPEQVVELEASWVVARHDGCAARECFDGDRRQRLEE